MLCWDRWAGQWTIGKASRLHHEYLSTAACPEYPVCSKVPAQQVLAPPRPMARPRTAGTAPYPRNVARIEVSRIARYGIAGHARSNRRLENKIGGACGMVAHSLRRPGQVEAGWSRSAVASGHRPAANTACSAKRRTSDNLTNQESFRTSVRRDNVEPQTSRL